MQAWCMILLLLIFSSFGQSQYISWMPDKKKVIRSQPFAGTGRFLAGLSSWVCGLLLTGSELVEGTGSELSSRWGSELVEGTGSELSSRWQRKKFSLVSFMTWCWAAKYPSHMQMNGGKLTWAAKLSKLICFVNWRWTRQDFLKSS